MDLFYGITYNIRGLLFALKSPKLIVLGLLRFGIVLFLTVFCMWMVLYWHNEILNAIWAMPETGFMLYLWKALSWILSLFLGVVSMVLAYLAAQILFCVFIMDYMSRITENMLLGQTIEDENVNWFSFFWYLIKQEIPRAIVPVMISLLIMVLGLVTPLSILIIILSSVCAAVFLAWDNTDLVPARRMLSFKDRLEFLKKNLLFHIGFGLVFLIPWLNILFLSFAPVGATMYYLDKTNEDPDR